MPCVMSGTHVHFAFIVFSLAYISSISIYSFLVSMSLNP